MVPRNHSVCPKHNNYQNKSDYYSSVSRAFLTLPIKQLTILFVLLLSGCSTPKLYLHDKASSFSYQRIELRGTPYTHVSYLASGSRNSSPLHVYIEGDGRPWRSRFFIASDPTPRSSVMFELMAIDSQRSLYLGRPCYLGQATVPPCTPLLWTYKRHSSEVIQSMKAALNNYLDSAPANSITFIGHSGGGALAMLLAPHFPQTTAVVTLAGNLDLEAWTTHHGYTPLHGSINPATQPALPKNIHQIHLAGGKDAVTPAWMIRAALKNQPDSEFILLEHATHTCCWMDIWPTILKKLDHIKQAQN